MILRAEYCPPLITHPIVVDMGLVKTYMEYAYWLMLFNRGDLQTCRDSFNRCWEAHWKNKLESEGC